MTASKDDIIASGEPVNADARDQAADARRALAWLHGARFLITASKLGEMPSGQLPEIAFVGRSNAGKSSAINALTGQKRLAFASKTPGRTQHLNVFEVGPRDAPDAWLVDLPGYGYAAVERAAKTRWQHEMTGYLAMRRNLEMIVLLVDSRHGITDADQTLLDYVAERIRNGSVKLLVLLTKADKLNRRDTAIALGKAEETLGALATDESDIAVAAFSSTTRIGLDDAAIALRGAVDAEPAAGATV